MLQPASGQRGAFFPFLRGLSRAHTGASQLLGVLAKETLVAPWRCLLWCEPVLAPALCFARPEAQVIPAVCRCRLGLNALVSPEFRFRGLEATVSPPDRFFHIIDAVLAPPACLVRAQAASLPLPVFRHGKPLNRHIRKGKGQDQASEEDALSFPWPYRRFMKRSTCLPFHHGIHAAGPTETASRRVSCYRQPSAGCGPNPATALPPGSRNHTFARPPPHLSLTRN